VFYVCTCIASIISKKAAENVSALVLDVKVGRASFSQTLADARHLAKNLVRISNCNSICFISKDMKILLYFRLARRETKEC
jgi:thymidine phosphorylase